MAGNDAMYGGRSRTILWCVPRSGSTAITKCLSFIDGMETWFEPYTYCRAVRHYAKVKLNLQLPPEYVGNEDAYRQMADTFDDLSHCKSKPENFSPACIKSFLENSSQQHAFVKDIGYKVDERGYGFLPEGYTHTFLIRHPLRVYTSLRVAVYRQFSAVGILTGEAADEKTFDIGRDHPFTDPSQPIFKKVYDLWKFVGEKSDSTPIVIDSDDLMSNPAEILPKYCRAVGLPYNDSLVKWDASMEVLNDWKIPADGAIKTLVHMYGRAVNSSGFMPPNPMPDRSQVTSDVIRCADENMPYYTEMYNARIKI